VIEFWLKLGGFLRGMGVLVWVWKTVLLAMGCTEGSGDIARNWKFNIIIVSHVVLTHVAINRESHPA
jgi:hypothetical protein